jgi:hypothetical protein
MYVFNENIIKSIFKKYELLKIIPINVKLMTN